MESISYWMFGGYQLLVFQGSPLCKHSGTELVVWEMHTLAYNHFVNKRQKVLSKLPFYHYPSYHNCCSGKRWKMKRLHAGFPPGHCCALGILVEVYYRWPAYVHFVFLCISSAYVFITAWGWGDPHITTLDDKVYTFNGLGEYTLLQLTAASGNGTFTLQGRTELVINSTATQFSAFAFGSPSTDIVEVS